MRQNSKVSDSNCNKDSWYWDIPAVKERQVDWGDNKAGVWILDCLIMFDMEERHNDQWFDLCRAKNTTFVLAFWMNVYWRKYSPVTVFWSIPVSNMASVCAVLAHQMHLLKSPNGQNKPFLSGLFLRLLCICLCSFVWSAILMEAKCPRTWLCVLPIERLGLEMSFFEAVHWTSQ